MVSPEELAGPDRARQLFGAEVVDADEAKVGTVTEVFLDDDTDQPKWVSIRTGWFGTNESLVPLQGAQFGDGRIRVQYDKATIKAAPRSDEGQPLSRDDEGQLYRHYHRETSGRHARTDDAAADTGAVSGAENAAGADRDAPPSDDGLTAQENTTDGGMVRSEERLAVGTERVATGRARMRKFLVTQEEQITVSVAREDVRVEYVTDVDPAASDARAHSVSAGPEPGGAEPAGGGSAGAGSAGGASAGAGSAGADQRQGGLDHDRLPDRRDNRNLREHNATDRDGWLVLYAQRPVVTMEWVPVERVRLGTVPVTAEETVTGEVRKEQLDVVTDEQRDAVPDPVPDRDSDQAAGTRSRERQDR